MGYFCSIRERRTLKSLGKEGREIHFFKKADTKKKLKKKTKSGKKLKKNSDIKREKKTATNLIVRNEQCHHKYVQKIFTHTTIIIKSSVDWIIFFFDFLLRFFANTLDEAIVSKCRKKYILHTQLIFRVTCWAFYNFSTFGNNYQLNMYCTRQNFISIYRFL